jgi:predicted Fe-S protein YdhL (DUF1289 family)
MSASEAEPPLPIQRLAEQATVRTWLDAHGRHWGTHLSEAEVEERLEVLARFCASCGRQPDELVAWLFRPTPEGPRIRLKRRRLVMAMIDEFEQRSGGRAAGNTVRSFLIHNGVALSATPLR